MTDIDPFRIRAHVPEFDAISTDYKVRSDATRRQHRAWRDLSYGEHPDERLDLFLPEGNGPKPVHVFIHGGYWRANVKEDYAFVAESVIAAGAIAVIVEYTLMPKVRLATLVDQVRRAAAWVATHAAEFGGDARAISASGHSAGGHLASYLLSRGATEATGPAVPVRKLLLVSGIYDLAPMTQSFVQPEIALTAEEVAAWTPLGATPAVPSQVTLAVGENETAPFHAQAADYDTVLRRHGAASRLVTVPGLDHMSIVREMGEPASAMGRLVAEVIDRSRH